jgi:broad specificity phosphatase PhoE
MKQLFFVRHGQTEWNAERRMQGQWNSDLNELGRRQADDHGKLLLQHGIEAMFVSPLARTRETAQVINSYLSLPLVFDDRIMEWDCGDWSGHRYDEVMQKWSRQWAEFQADRYHYRGPGCENFPDMIDRTAPFLAELMQHQANVIAVVSHGMIAKAMVASLLQLSEAETLALHQPNDVVFRLSIDGPSWAADHFIGGDGPIAGLFN